MKRKISLDLSPRLRLDLHLVRRRGVADEPLLPSLEELRQVRSGHKVSRFFRHLFEHSRIKKILGSNLALAILVTSTLGVSTTQAQEIEPEQTVIAVTENPVKTESGTVYPVEKVIITQGYHFFHPAIDFDGLTGDPINPIMAGVVEKIEYSRFGLGTAIYVNHGNSLISVYAHLSKVDVQVGDKVTTTTKIGEMGATGRAFGDHLHLEVHQDGHPINPLSILPRL